MTDGPTAPARRRRFRRLVVYAGCVGVVAVGIAAAVLSRDAGEAKLPPQSHSDYCNLVRSFQSALASPDPAAGNAGTASQLAGALGLIDAARDNAPDEIKGDMEAFASAYRQVENSLATGAYDPNTIGPDALAPVQTSAFESALAQIAAYNKKVCKTD